MPKRREYIFTNHLRERYVQRSQKKYDHLQHCYDVNCDTCKALVEACRSEVAKNRKEIDTELAQRIDAADENRAYVNNSEFMNWYYEKYGYEKGFEFLVHEDLLFVVVIDNGKKVVVTCVHARTHLAGRASLRPKYNGIKKQREEAMQILE